MELCLSTFVGPEWTTERLVAAAQRWEFRGLEFRCDARQAHGAEPYIEPYEQKRLRGLLQDNDTEAVGLATSLELAHPHVTEHLATRLELAGNLGARGLRLFVGDRPRTMTAYEYEQVLVDRLRFAATLADSYNVEVWLETHPPCATGADLAALIGQAQARNVGVVWDLVETARAGEDPPATLGHLRGLLRLVRLHDAVFTADGVLPTPLGDGQAPVEQVLTTLAGHDANTYLCAQWIGPLYHRDPDAALETFRKRLTALCDRLSLRV